MTRLRLAAVLSGAAAVMHVAASAGHVHESLVLAPIFAVAAVLQLAWAVVSTLVRWRTLVAYAVEAAALAAVAASFVVLASGVGHA